VALLLTLYEQGDGDYVDPSQLHRTFATQVHPNGVSVSLASENLAEAFASWQRYIERQYEKCAIGAFWHEVLNTLRIHDPHSVPGEHIITRLCDLVSESLQVRTLVGAKGADATFSEFRALAVAAAPRERSAFQRTMWEMSQDITDVSDTAPAAQDRLSAAIHLLALLITYWKENWSEMSIFHRRMTWSGGVERLSLHWLNQALEQRDADTVLETIRWLIEGCVIGQANRVAFDKLSQGDRFFIKRDDSGYRLAESLSDRASYFNFDADRLLGATRLLVDLELLKWNERITITPAGRRLKTKFESAIPLSRVRSRFSTLEDLGDSAA
jgi:hypothetical protein